MAALSSPRDAVYFAAAGGFGAPTSDSDPDVIAVGASFTKVKKNAAAGMDLLTGLMWVHRARAQIRSARGLAGGLCGSVPLPNLNFSPFICGLSFVVKAHAPISA
jgi:hypothetical protein